MDQRKLFHLGSFSAQQSFLSALCRPGHPVGILLRPDFDIPELSSYQHADFIPELPRFGLEPHWPSSTVAKFPRKLATFVTADF